MILNESYQVNFYLFNLRERWRIYVCNVRQQIRGSKSQAISCRLNPLEHSWRHYDAPLVTANTYSVISILMADLIYLEGCYIFLTWNNFCAV